MKRVNKGKVNTFGNDEQSTWKFLLQIGSLKLSVLSHRKKGTHRPASAPHENKLPITLEEYLVSWLASIKSSRSPRTIQLYDTAIRQRINPLIGDLYLEQLCSKSLETMYSKLSEQFGQSFHSINFTHSVLRAALNHAKKQGVLDQNPCEVVPVPKHKTPEMEFLDEHQARLFLSTANEIKDRFYPLYHLAIHTGMRMAELLGLKWQDIDWKHKTLHVQRQVTHPPGGGFRFSPLKSTKSRRTILLGDQTISLLTQQKGVISNLAKRMHGGWTELDLVFPSNVGTPVPKTNLRRSFYRTLKASKLPRIRFHDLRHTSATLLLNHGIPVLIVSRRLEKTLQNPLSFKVRDTGSVAKPQQEHMCYN